MAVVAVTSTKGGVGKTTLVISLADAFARQGGKVAIIDADPNGHVATWRVRAPDDCSVVVISEPNETRIQQAIIDAANLYNLVFVDLEGAASQTVTYAIAESDMILIPTKISGMDLQEAFRTNQMVKRIETMLRGKRYIPSRVVLTQMSPLQSKVAEHARKDLKSEGLSVLKTEIIQRVCYQSLHFTGETTSSSDINEKAKQEINSVLDEVLETLQSIELENSGNGVN